MTMTVSWRGSSLLLVYIRAPAPQFDGRNRTLLKTQLSLSLSRLCGKTQLSLVRNYSLKMRFVFVLLSFQFFLACIGEFTPVVNICPNQCLSSRNALLQTIRQCHRRAVLGLCKVQRCQAENGDTGFECTLPQNSVVVKNEDFDKANMTIYFEWDPSYGFMGTAVNLRGTRYGDYCAADNDVITLLGSDMSNNGGDWFELDLEAALDQKIIKRFTRIGLLAGWKGAKVDQQGAVQVFIRDKESSQSNPDIFLHLRFNPGNYQPVSGCPYYKVGTVQIVRTSKYTRYTLEWTHERTSNAAHTLNSGVLMPSWFRSSLRLLWIGVKRLCNFFEYCS